MVGRVSVYIFAIVAKLRFAAIDGQVTMNRQKVIPGKFKRKSDSSLKRDSIRSNLHKDGMTTRSQAKQKEEIEKPRLDSQDFDTGGPFSPLCDSYNSPASTPGQNESINSHDPLLDNSLIDEACHHAPIGTLQNKDILSPTGDLFALPVSTPPQIPQLTLEPDSATNVPDLDLDNSVLSVETLP